MSTNRRLELINLIQGFFLALDSVHPDYLVDRYAVGESVNVWKRPVDPVNLTAAELPSIWFGYGDTNLNDRQVGVEFQAETFRLVINAAIGGDDLITNVANIHRTVEQITWAIKQPADFAGAGIEEARLESAESLSQGLGEREIMQFTIAVDWFYRIGM